MYFLEKSKPADQEPNKKISVNYVPTLLVLIRDLQSFKFDTITIDSEKNPDYFTKKKCKQFKTVFLKKFHPLVVQPIFSLQSDIYIIIENQWTLTLYKYKCPVKHATNYYKTISTWTITVTVQCSHLILKKIHLTQGRMRIC